MHQVFGASDRCREVERRSSAGSRIEVVSSVGPPRFRRASARERGVGGAHADAELERLGMPRP